MQRYLRYFAVPAFIVIGSATVLAAIFEPVTGDLTRVGAYAERDFGWNAVQPVVHINANGERVVNPDVLVLGDSFSASNTWQSALATKVEVQTLSFRYEQVGCIAGWLDYALNQSSSKIVAVETIEREFLQRFAVMVQCKSDHPVAFEVIPHEFASVRSSWPPELHVYHTFHTAVNTLEMSFSGRALKGAAVVNAPIKSDCGKFSNRRADRLLYFAEDDDKLRWTQEQIDRSVANVKRIQKLFEGRGKKFIFVLVPDKSSTYRECLLDDPGSDARKRMDATHSLISAGVNTPNLLKVFHENAKQIVDLYLPNDTHLSTAGFVLMAKHLEPFFSGNPAR